MATDLNQIHQTLLGESSRQQVVLTEHNLPDRMSVRCIGNLLSGQSLTIDQAVVRYDQEKRVIRLSGTCPSIYQEKNARINVFISARPGDEGGVGLLVGFELSPGRTLAEQFRDQIMMTSADERESVASLLSAFRVERGEVVFSTFPQSASKFATALFNDVLPTKAGSARVSPLSFGANIFSEAKLDEKVLGLAGLGRGTAYPVLVTVSGERAGEPVICQLPVSQAFGFGDVQLSLSDLQVMAHRRGGVSIGASESVNVTGSIALGKQSLPVTGAFLPKAGVVSLSLSQGDGASIDVDAMTKLLLGASLKSVIPIGADTLKLTAEQFDVQFALVEKELSHTELGMSVVGDLELVPGILKVRKPGFWLAVDNPLDPNSRRPDLALSAELLLGDSRVLLGARAPQFDLYGELAEGGEVAIGAIFEHFHIDSPLFASMTLSDLWLITFDSNHGFQLGGRLSASWKVALFGISFEFRSIDLTLQYLAGSFGISFDSECTFAGADYKVSGSGDTRGENLSFSASSGPGQTVALGDLSRSLVAPFGVELPKKLSSLRLQDLEFTLDGADGSVAISGRQADGDKWPIDIGGHSFEIRDMLLKTGLTDAKSSPTFYGHLKGWLVVADNEIEVFANVEQALDFEAYLPAQSLTQLLAQFVDISNVPIPDVELGDTTLAISADQGMVFKSSLAADFHDLAAKLKIPLPDGLARVELSVLDLRINPGAGTWSMKVGTPTTIQLPAGSDNYLKVSGVTVSLAHDAQITVQCEFTIGGKAVVTPDLNIESSGLACSWKTGTKGHWNVDGAVTVTIDKKPYKFNAVIDIDGDHSRFGLQYEKSLTLASWEAVRSSVTADNLTVSVEKDGDDGSYSWSFSGNTHFNIIDKFMTADGLLQLEGGKLEITASVSKPPTIKLPLPDSPTINLDLSPLRLIVGGDQKGPVIRTGATVTLANIPAPADKVFSPRPTGGTLKIDDDGFAITFKPPDDPTIDVTFAKGTKWEVQFPKIRIETFLLDRITVGDKPTWRLGAKLHVNRLGQLNRLVGGADLFEDSVDLLLSLGSGLSIVPETSPLKSVPLRTLPDKTVWTEWVRILDIGTFSFRVPEFAFDFEGGRWKASGGIDTQGELSVPMQPIKWLFKKCNLPDGLLKAMPNAIPLVELHLDKPEFYDQLMRMIGKVDKKSQPVFKKVADLLKQGSKRLPKNFQSYLDLYIPKGFTFDIAVEPTGGVSFGVKTTGDKPLKMLMPTMSPLPGFAGLTVYSISFGATGGGTIGVLKADGWLDQIDALSLTYALTTGEGKAISNRFIMRNATALVPMAFPVPIPLFYDQVGWEYHDVLGIGMQFHAKFPDPQPPLAAWIALIGDLLRFFKEGNYFLHEKDHLPKEMAFPFTLQPTTLSLPSYLGGATLGLEKELPSLPVGDTLARGLDGMKSGNLGWLIQSVPLKYPKDSKSGWIRIGKKDAGISFGPLKFGLGVGWCITTEEEFKSEIIGNKQAEEILGAIDVTKTLKHLPKSKAGAAYDKGFIVVLAGGANLVVLEYTAQFGIAVTSTGGFESRIFMEGGITSVVTLAIDGGIQVQPDGTTKIDGTCDLKVVDRSMIKIYGLIEVTDHSFFVSCTLTLADTLDFGGGLYIGNDGVYIEGGFAWHYAAGKKISEAKIRATFDANGMLIALKGKKIFNANCTVGVYVNAKGVPGALISFDLTGLNDLFMKEIGRSLAEVNQTVEQEKSGFEQLVKNNVKKVQNFDQLRTGLPTFLDGIRAKVVSIVKSQANKAWDQLPGYKKTGAKIAGYSKATIRNEAVSQAQRFMKPLDTLKRQLIAIERKKIKDDEERVQQTRAAILKTLNDSIKLNGRKVPIKVWGITVKNITVKFSTKQLVDLRNLVNGLPSDWSKAEAEHARIADSFASRASKALTDITESVTQGARDQIPQLKAIEIDSSLNGFKGPEVKVDVTMKQGKVIKEFKADVNLTNLAKSIPAITKSFVKAIA